ncbi:MAG: HPP family protein [Gammaproteobacteria bacterium]
MSWYGKTLEFLGIEPEPVSTAEKVVSTLGGIAGIFCVAAISYQLTGARGAALIVPSMGASAVLLFAVPHGRLSQPWSLIGGHGISAVIGVICYAIAGETALGAGLAVGLAIGAMHLSNCIHPPGGATALAAVIGGPAIHALGFGYVLVPIGLNVLIILLVAVIFNGFLPWRRYPASLMRFSEAPGDSRYRPETLLEKQYIEQAMADMDLIVDITTDDLQRLFALSIEHAEARHLQRKQIKLGHYYTNARHGSEWSVRQIIDEAAHTNPAHDMVIYRVVEGRGLRSSGSCTRSEFAQWAARELVAKQKPD